MWVKVKTDEKGEQHFSSFHSRDGALGGFDMTDADGYTRDACDVDDKEAGFVLVDDDAGVEEILRAWKEQQSKKQVST